MTRNEKKLKGAGRPIAPIPSMQPPMHESIKTKKKEWSGMTELKNHQNIFESYLAQDIFVLDIIEKIANDWKTSHKANSYNRENFEEFVTEDLAMWIELQLEQFCYEEFGLDEYEEN